MNRPGVEIVQLRDRHGLPFFQVHLAAVRTIREAASGPRRVRAIGFYALVCQLANEQRRSGEHRVVRVSYDTLVAHGQAGRSTVKALLDTLACAGVIRCERVNDPARGAAVSLLHLQIHEARGPRSPSRWLSTSRATGRAGVCCVTSGWSWCCWSSAASSGPSTVG
ncbi:MAG: hypothetical protein ACLP0J_22940 [Solirubrobacteraceae bacterium]